jgi:hypothetical protein
MVLELKGRGLDKRPRRLLANGEKSEGSGFDLCRKPLRMFILQNVFKATVSCRLIFPENEIVMGYHV